MNLFNRIIELKIGDTEITGLDIAFEVEKDLSTNPNPGHIEIYNLSPDNRVTLSKYKRVPVTIKAGYQGQVGIIFQGDMVRCNHELEKASWKTTLSCGDGATAIQTKRINKSYAKGTPLKTVIGDTAKELNLPMSNSGEELKNSTKKLKRSHAMSGTAMSVLFKLLRHEDMGVSVQNGVVQILKKGGALPKTAISLSSESGLMMSPEIGSNGEVILKARIMPELAPGRLVHINSAMYERFLVIQKIRFSGANFGDSWECEMECNAQ